mgnify:CR=1 FL=1
MSKAAYNSATTPGVIQSNGVIRIGRKGLKKFAFGEDGAPFEVDVVVSFQEWIGIDDGFRSVDENGVRTIPNADIPAYHQAALGFVSGLAGGGEITVAEALDFLARLREQYDELADFFQPKLREKPGSQDTSEAELRFSAEEP